MLDKIGIDILFVVLNKVEYVWMLVGFLDCCMDCFGNDFICVGMGRVFFDDNGIVCS